MENRPLKVGDHARHHKFGIGIVTDADTTSVQVRFEGDALPRRIMRIFVSRAEDPRDTVRTAQRARHHEQAANDNNPSDISFINPADWNNKPIPKREWFIPELVPMRTVTILNGDGGVGKSLLALQLAAASSMGAETLGFKLAMGRSLYIGAEDEADEFHRRLADITASHGRQLSDLCEFRLLSLADADATLAAADRGGRIQPTELYAKIVKYAVDFMPRLIVLDTVADLFGGDEIKRTQARQFIGMLRTLAISLDAAVILLAHPSLQGMQSGSGSSGSTGWNNSVRSRLYLTRDKDDQELRILEVMKANYGQTGKTVKLRWTDGAFNLDDGKPSVGDVMMAARAERVFCDLLSMLNRQGRNVCHVPGTTYAPAVMEKLPECDGVPKARLVEAMNALLKSGDIKIVSEGPKSKRRQRLILASEDFGSDREE